MGRVFLNDVSRSAGAALRRGLRRARADEHGQAMIELGIVVAVLVAIAIIVVDFGKAINYSNSENHVANLAARYAAVGNLPSAGTCAMGSSPPAASGLPTVTNLTTFIDCELWFDSPELVKGGGAHGVRSYPSNNAGGATVCVSVPQNAVGQPVTVKITSDYNWLPLPILGGGSFTSTPLAGTATMRLEGTYPWTDSQAGACS